MSIVAPAPTSVYRYYDEEGTLLYVGITARAATRQREHNQGKEWWPFVASQAVEHYDSRPEAAEREQRLIALRRPPFNRQHNPNWRALREDYLAAVPRRIPADELFQQQKRLPLTLVGEPRDDVLHMRCLTEHRPLARFSDPGALLLAPGKVAQLERVVGVGGYIVFRFSGRRIPRIEHAEALYKLVARTPFQARLHEVRAA